MITKQFFGDAYKIVGGGVEFCACCGREIKKPVKTAYGLLGENCYTTINAIFKFQISEEDKKKKHFHGVTSMHFDFVKSH